MPHRSSTSASVAARTLTAVPPPWLSVVVPAYNEAPWILAAAEQMRDRLEALGRPWELIVVDNASPDGTADRLAPLLADERIQVLRNDENRGKGYSMRRGMLASIPRMSSPRDEELVPTVIRRRTAKISIPGL